MFHFPPGCAITQNQKNLSLKYFEFAPNFNIREHAENWAAQICLE